MGRQWAQGSRPTGLAGPGSRCGGPARAAAAALALSPARHSWTFAYCTVALASARATPHITQGLAWRLLRSLPQEVITRTLRRQRMG